MELDSNGPDKNFEKVNPRVLAKKFQQSDMSEINKVWTVSETQKTKRTEWTPSAGFTNTLTGSTQMVVTGSTSRRPVAITCHKQHP